MMTGDGDPVPESFGSPAPIGVGLRLGRYELLHEIATGGMATVYLARARAVAGFERVVAIKVCHSHLRHEEEFSSMFLDEARLAARIHHPNVVSTLDVGEGDHLYLVMEYVEGDRISGLIKAASKKHERMPIPVTLRIAVDLLSGLHAAHELKDNSGAALNIVHRDVSPQNILVGVDGSTRITDFGIAKAEARLTVTREGQVKGKMSYMAPEQLTAGPTVNRRADVYAAGVVLWEALTGRRLFRADTEGETLHLVLNATIPAPSTVAPEVPPELDAIVKKALERDPDDRFQNAEEFADALEAIPNVKVATSRVVSTYINDLLSDPIGKRRELVRRLSESGPVAIASVTEHSVVRATQSSADPFNSVNSARTNIPPLPGRQSAPPAGAIDEAIEIEPEPAARGVKPVYLAVVALALVLGVVAAIMARSNANTPQQTPPTPVAQTPPTPPTPVAQTPPTPAEPPAAPPTTPPEPPAQPANEPVVAANTDTPARRQGRVPVRVVRPAVGARTNPGGASTRPPPTTPTAPQGSSEFRPSGI